MDWNGNHRPFVSQPENSFSFLYNYNYDQFPGSEMKHPIPMVAHGVMEKNNNSNSNSNDGNIVERKKRLTNEQLETLESSFQEEIKLDPDRKMKLAQDLVLHPRQVAVWFQNRRARWKAKQLETLYHALKQEFDVVSTEKQNLQQEVVALRAILKEQATSKKQISTGYTEMSGEETVESTSVGMPMSSTRCRGRGTNNNHNQNIVEECNYGFNVVDDGYNPMIAAPPYWGVLPSFP